MSIRHSTLKKIYLRGKFPNEFVFSGFTGNEQSFKRDYFQYLNTFINLTSSERKVNIKFFYKKDIEKSEIL